MAVLMTKGSQTLLSVRTKIKLRGGGNSKKEGEVKPARKEPG